MKRHANAEHYNHFLDSFNRADRKAARRQRESWDYLTAEELNAREAAHRELVLTQDYGKQAEFKGNHNG